MKDTVTSCNQKLLFLTVFGQRALTALCTSQCKHSPLPPAPLTERGIAVQMCHAFTIAFVLAMLWEMPGFDIPRQTWQCNVKHNRLLGKTAMVLPAGCPSSVGVIAMKCWTKSRSPRYSPEPWGGGYK